MCIGELGHAGFRLALAFDDAGYDPYANEAVLAERLDVPTRSELPAGEVDVDSVCRRP